MTDNARTPSYVELTSVLDADPGPELAAALDLLQGLAPPPALAPLVRWEPAGEGVALVHRVPVAAEPLEVLRARGPLRLGAAVAIARALVPAVRVLHEAGLAHGAIGTRSVLAGTDGEVVLGAAGLAWGLAPGRVGGPGADADVAALADLVRHLVGEVPLPAALVLVLLRAAEDDVSLRPTLDELDAALAGCELAGRDDSPADIGAELAGASGRRRERAAPPSLLASSASRPSAPRERTSQERANRPDASSFLDRPVVLRPAGGRPRARVRPRVVTLIGAALVAAALLVRVVAPATAEPPATATASMRAAAATPSTSAPGTAAAAAATGEATPSPTPPATPSEWAGATPTASAAASNATAPSGTAPSAREPSAVNPGSAVGRARAPVGGAPPRPAASSTGPAPRVTWAEVLSELDVRRHQALSAGSRTALARAVDPAGPAWAADAALADRVREAGATLRGGELTVTQARAVAVGPAVVVLAVVDSRSAYTVRVDGAGTPVAARGPASWTVRLSRTDGSWRIHTVRAAP